MELRGSPKMACGHVAASVAAAYAAAAPVAWLQLFGFMHKTTAHKCNAAAQAAVRCKSCKFNENCNHGNPAALSFRQGLNPILRC